MKGLRYLVWPTILLVVFISLASGYSEQEEVDEQDYTAELEGFRPRNRYDDRKNRVENRENDFRDKDRFSDNRERYVDERQRDTRPPTWQETKHNKKYKTSKKSPWYKNSRRSEWRKDSPKRKYYDSWDKETPKHKKFQNLVSKLIDKGLLSKSYREPRHKEPRRYYEREPIDQPRPSHDHRDPFEEYKDRNGVLVSIPLETLKLLTGLHHPHHHPHRPRELVRHDYTDKPPRRHRDRPPKTINAPRKIDFDDSTNVDQEGRASANFQDKGVKVPSGSYQDQVYSQWYVVTRDGYEYEGDPKELNTIFELANKQNLPSTSDVIPDSLLNSMNTMSSIQHKRNVVQSDSRQMVNSPDHYPYSVIGRLDVGCTGTMIGPNHILTAGHCVYDYDKGQWYNNLDFRRCKDCDPDEGELFSWDLAITVKGWKENGYPSYDYALIVVTKSSPRWMTFGWSNSLHLADVQLVGYPDDKDDRCMWETSCNIGQEWNDLLGYKCDTSSGMSGGPVYKHESRSEKAVVYCVHAYGADDYNACAQITRPRFTQFINWISNYY